MKILALTLIFSSTVFAQNLWTVSQGRTDSVKVSLTTSPEKACDDQLKKMETELENLCSEISKDCRISNSSSRVVSFKKVGLFKKKLKVICDYTTTITAL